MLLEAAEESTEEVRHLDAETTLAVLLFLDSEKLNLIALRQRPVFPREWVGLICLRQIILAPITGKIIAGLGGCLLLEAKPRGTTSTFYERISAFAIAAMA